MLLKVPKWLSESWQRSPPDVAVADLDLDAGQLHLIFGAGQGRPDRPTVFGVDRRPSPELFAFSTEADGEARVNGCIKESLHVRADLGDARYKHMLQTRFEENAITAGSRSVVDLVLHQ